MLNMMYGYTNLRVLQTIMIVNIMIIIYENTKTIVKSVAACYWYSIMGNTNMVLGI